MPEAPHTSTLYYKVGLAQRLWAAGCTKTLSRVHRKPLKCATPDPCARTEVVCLPLLCVFFSAYYHTIVRTQGTLSAEPWDFCVALSLSIPAHTHTHTHTHTYLILTRTHARTHAHTCTPPSPRSSTHIYSSFLHLHGHTHTHPTHRACTMACPQMLVGLSCGVDTRPSHAYLIFLAPSFPHVNVHTHTHTHTHTSRINTHTHTHTYTHTHIPHPTHTERARWRAHTCWWACRACTHRLPSGQGGEAAITSTPPPPRARCQR